MLFKFGSQGANCWHQYNCAANSRKVQRQKITDKQEREQMLPLSFGFLAGLLAEQVGVAG